MPTLGNRVVCMENIFTGFINLNTVKTFLILKVVFCIKEKNKLTQTYFSLLEFFTSLVIKTKIIALLYVLYKMLVVNQNGKCSSYYYIGQYTNILCFSAKSVMRNNPCRVRDKSMGLNWTWVQNKQSNQAQNHPKITWMFCFFTPGVMRNSWHGEATQHWQLKHAWNPIHHPDIENCFMDQTGVKAV